MGKASENKSFLQGIAVDKMKIENMFTIINFKIN